MTHRNSIPIGSMKRSPLTDRGAAEYENCKADSQDAHAHSSSRRAFRATAWPGRHRVCFSALVREHHRPRSILRSIGEKQPAMVADMYARCRRWVYDLRMNAKN